MSVDGPAKRAGRVLGRSPEDVQPYIDLLKDNWYDTMESLKGANVADLVQLGLPQRFVKELIIVVDGDSGHSREDNKDQGNAYGNGSRSLDSGGWKNDRRDDTRDKWRDDKRDDRQTYDNDRGDWYGGGKSSSKGRSYDDRNDWYDRSDKGKSKGKGKDGKGKDGKGKDGKGKDGKGKGGKGKDIGSGCYEDEQNRKGDGKGKDKGGKGSKDEYEHVHKIVMETDDVDPAFGFAGGVIGKGGKNMKHIREATGAWVSLRGIGSNSVDPATNAESDEPLHVLVRARSKESMEEAINITNDLIDTVFEQYDEWLRDDSRAEEGKGKGKSSDSDSHKGKGKGGKGKDGKGKDGKGKDGKGKDGKGKDGKGKDGKGKDGKGKDGKGKDGKGKDGKGKDGKGKKGKGKGKGKHRYESWDAVDGGDYNEEEPPQKRARTSAEDNEYAGDDSAPDREDYDESLDLLE